MRRKLKVASLVVLALLIIGAIYFAVDYIAYHPGQIVAGENKYILKNNAIEEQGLNEFKTIIEKTVDFPTVYTVAFFEATINENSVVQSFTLSLDTFDSQNEYIGTASFVYSSKKLTYSAPSIVTNMLVHTYDQNSAMDYLDKQLKKIPLKEQISVSKFNRYVLQYQPFTKIDKDTPIFDGRAGGTFGVLSKEDYDAGKGGISDGKTNVVFRLYDGTSITSKQQYLYVFKPIVAETATGSQFGIQCDYFINNGTLKITQDYGEHFIDADITKDELTSTMDFYRNRLTLPKQSIFISADTDLPIAYFYMGNPKLKIYAPQDKIWTTIDAFPNADDFGREITKRAVGFVTKNFGYAALGTDWSMGAGESKMCYFTTDGGKTWAPKPLPMPMSARTLIDICMANEKVGAVTLEPDADKSFPLVFVTDTTGDQWTQITLPFADLPQEIQYLSDIESFEYKDGVYTLTLSQEDNGVNKAVFVSDQLSSGWKFVKAYKSNIHQVG